MASSARDPLAPAAAAEPLVNFRWSRTRESDDFFVDEDRLRGRFYLLVAAAGCLLAGLAAGLWRLQTVALAPPAFVGIAHGLVFTGRPEGVASVRDSDFDSQLADTVEVLFGRTEKGLPPAIREFCAPEVVAAVDQAYRDATAKYPAGYVQTFSLLEAKPAAARPGLRRIRYRGLLASRSLSAAQTSPIYLDCTFALGPPTPLNAAGWRLVRADALGADDYYREERERAVRQTLNLPPNPSPP